MARKKSQTTPAQEVHDAFQRLSLLERQAFLRMLGTSLPVEDAVAIFNELPVYKEDVAVLRLNDSLALIALERRKLQLYKAKGRRDIDPATFTLGQQILEYQSQHPETWTWRFIAMRFAKDQHDESEKAAIAKCRNARKVYCEKLELPLPPDPRKERGK